MVNPATVVRPRSLIDDYCLQLGLLVERRHTERALITAREQALEAARLADSAMRQAQAADRAKSQFLGNMTHELRTPLNAIIGFSQIIESAPSQPDTAGYAKYIRESGTQLLSMLNGVLDLARIDAGKLTLDEQLVDVVEIVQSALRAVRARAAEKSVQLDATAVGSVGLYVDPSRLSQVLVNLLSNAVKFTAEGGTVGVAVMVEPAGSLQITVSDTGCGIPGELLTRVLQPFGQIEEHLTRENDGLGLGLPIAAALIRLHGGDVVLHSEVGVGTTVEVRLPAERVRAADPIPMNSLPI